MPSLLVFEVLTTLPALETNLPSQNQRMAIVDRSKTEMAFIRARLCIQQVLRSNLSPATEFNVPPGDKVRVFREDDRKWHGPYIVDK